MKQKTLAFIGAGNMASSLIGGLINENYPPQQIWTSCPSEQELQQKHGGRGIHLTTDNTQAAQAADVLIFAVKPQVLASVAKEVAATVQQRKPLVISIVAGIREQDLQRWLGGEVSIVRCMPNTPALVGSAATGLFANQFVSDEQKNVAESILRGVGITLWMNQEKDLDIVTALSGSGPAYFFLVMEILTAAAIAQGLSAKDAELLTVQTALGAAHMALEANIDTAALRQQVTSPGGTTERALEILEAGNIRELFANALTAAKARAAELADSLGATT